MVRERITFWLASGLALLLLVGASACAAGSANRKDPRIAVLKIDGHKAADDAIADVIDSRYEVVSNKSYAQTARKLDAESTKSKDVRKVSRKLDIDAMVAGKFVKRGKRKYELRLSLRAGDSGKEFDKIRIKLKSKKLSSRDRDKIKDKLFAALSEVDSWTERDEQEPEASGRSNSGRRVGGKSSERERERARKIREKNLDRDRRRDAERDDKRMSKNDRKRAERAARDEKKERDRADDKDRKRAEKEEREREEKEERKLAKRDRDDDRDKDDDRSKKDKESKRDRDERKAKEAREAKQAKKDKEAKEAKQAKKDKEAKKKKEKEAKKKKEKEETYEVVTDRDTSGQAIDDESPF